MNRDVFSLSMFSFMWWTFFSLLFKSSLWAVASAEPAACRIRLDEISTVSPGSNTHGPATNEHSYFLSFRFDDCKDKDYPTLSSYTVSILQFKGESTPEQIGYFDLQQSSPIMKTAGGTYTRMRTTFAEVHPRFFFGHFPANRGKEDGILIEWSGHSTPKFAIAPSSRRFPSDDNFLTLFLLLHYDKTKVQIHDELKNLLAVLTRNTAHKNVINPTRLPKEFNAGWKAIADKTVQALGVTVNPSTIKTSPVIAGLHRAVEDFTVTLVPDVHGGIRLDLPSSGSIRQCAGNWVLTRQAADLSTLPHCDELFDDIIPLVIVPAHFDWSLDFTPETALADESCGNVASSSNRRSQSEADAGCSLGPPTKRQRIDAPELIELILIFGGRAYATTTPLSSSHYQLFNYNHQISAAQTLFGDGPETLRQRKLTTRVQYLLPKQMRYYLESGFVTGITSSLVDCERVFDLISWQIYGSVLRADDLRDLIRKAKGVESDGEKRGQHDDWNRICGANDEEKKKIVRCYNLYEDLATYLPFHIAISFTDTDGNVQIIPFRCGVNDDPSTPVIFLDADKLRLYAHGNGFTDFELARVLPYNNEIPLARLIGTEQENEDSGSGVTGNCDDQGEEEHKRTTSETHKMLSQFIEATTNSQENRHVEQKMDEFHEKCFYLRRLKADQVEELIASNLISEKIIRTLFSDSRLLYIDISFDKQEKKIYFWCTACKDNGLRTVEHVRTVDWEINSGSTAEKIKSTLSNLREHHGRDHHKESVKLFDSKAEQRFRAELASLAVDSKLSPTCTMLTTAYFTAHSAFAGYRFPALCQLLRDCGVNIGQTNTCRSSYTRVLEMFLRVMRKRLIDYMVSNHVVFGMELDTATDSQGRVVLMILISATIDGHLREQVFGAVQLEGETGLAIYQAVIKKFEEHGFLEHLDEYLIAIATDGAPNMIGPGDGFGGMIIRRLKEHRKNAPRRSVPVIIPHFHCGAHRVELFVKDAFKEIAAEYELQTGWSETTTAIINQFANFFSVIAPKRLEGLKKTAEFQRLGGSLDNFLRIKRDYFPRWTSTGLESRKTFVRMLKCGWENLLEYDNDLTKMTSSKKSGERDLAFRAKTFLYIFRNLAFFSHLTFEIQLLECVNFLSLEAQRVDGTLIDFPRALGEYKKCIRDLCKNPFLPYTPVVRATAAKKAPKAGQAVPFMRNVLVAESTGLIPIANSKSGQQAILGERSSTLDALVFRLDFTHDKATSSTSTVVKTKDTVFDALYPLPRSRSQTPEHSARVQYEKEQKQQEKDAREAVDAEKVKDSLLYKKFMDAKFQLLDKPLRDVYESAFINKMRAKFYDKTLVWAASFTVDKLLFDPSFGTMKGEVDRKNREEFCKLFNFNAAEVEKDILILRRDFETQVSMEKRMELKEKPTDIVLFHYALIGKACYGNELKDLIAAIITMPINSAGVERAYSIFNFYMTNRRSSLSIDHLEAYVFIHINGPPPHLFVCDAYEAEWLKTREQTESIDKKAEIFIEEDDGDFPVWRDAFSSKKDVPPIKIYD